MTRILHVDLYVEVEDFAEVDEALMSLKARLGDSAWALGDFLVKEGGSA